MQLAQFDVPSTSANPEELQQQKTVFMTLLQDNSAMLVSA